MPDLIPLCAHCGMPVNEHVMDDTVIPPDKDWLDATIAYILIDKPRKIIIAEYDYERHRLRECLNKTLRIRSTTKLH